MTPHARLRTLTARFRRNERGASAIEFAMIAAFLSIILLNVVDISIFMQRKMEVVGAVRAGAQYALVDSKNATVALITSVVQDATSLSGVGVTVDLDLCGCSDGSMFTCSSGTLCTSGTTGRRHSYAQIDATYTHTWIFYPGTIDITSQATIRTQ
ncbi:MAG TPA: TadE/TadG family type IV pilus assembly protein [Magnetovibrio sp.]